MENTMEKVILNKSLAEKLISFMTDKKSKWNYSNVPTIKEVMKVLECRKACDYTPMKETDLYNNNSVGYCILQEVMWNVLGDKELI